MHFVLNQTTEKGLQRVNAISVNLQLTKHTNSLAVTVRSTMHIYRYVGYTCLFYIMEVYLEMITRTGMLREQGWSDIT
jgi:hypothetical protein